METTTTGGAEPVLMLHCSAGSGRQWDGLAALLSGRRALAPDLYGYGSAPSWMGPGPLTLSREAALATATLDPDDRGVHLVGHSYGGAVALRLAFEQPSRVRSLTLIEPVAFHVLRQGEHRDRHLLGAVHRVANAVIDGVLSGDYHRALESFIDYWSGAGAWDKMTPDARRRFSRAAPKIVLDFYAAMSEKTPLDAYRARLHCPVLILRGGRSPAPARRVAELLAGRIPGARLETVADAGHMLPLSHPGTVNSAVLAHIEAACGHGRQAA